jgi:hypothetical protein
MSGVLSGLSQPRDTLLQVYERRDLVKIRQRFVVRRRFVIRRQRVVQRRGYSFVRRRKTLYLMSARFSHFMKAWNLYALTV